VKKSTRLPVTLELSAWEIVIFLALTTTKGSISGLTSRSLKMHTTGLFQTKSDKSVSSEEHKLKELYNYIAKAGNLSIQPRFIEATISKKSSLD
jgi:hypothetical protein